MAELDFKKLMQDQPKPIKLADQCLHFRFIVSRKSRFKKCAKCGFIKKDIN